MCVKNIYRLIIVSSILIYTACAWAAPARAASRSLVFSTTPWTSPEELKKMYRPLLDYVEEKTGVHFDIVIFPTYDDFVKEVQGGYVQFAAVNAAGFARLWRDGADISYLATSLRQFGDKQRDYYTGYVIVRKDSGIKSFMDLNGKKFAFVSDDSSSGYKAPLEYMKSLNLDPKTFFRKYFFMGDHDEVLKAIRNRAVDGGAATEESYDMNVKKYGDIFNVIYKTPPLANDAWIAGNKVSKELGDRIAAVLLSVNNITSTKTGKYVLDPSLGLTEVGFSKRGLQFYLGGTAQAK
jgi:phosphate/phosphite/phosphonate ABC transporter binding protein